MEACVFCKCNEDLVLDFEDDQWWVTCMTCGARGPVLSDPQLAIDIWDQPTRLSVVEVRDGV